jgi:SH3-like domain-containing protein
MNTKASLSMVVLTSALVGSSVPGGAAETDSYFASFKSDQVYMREGPSPNNRVKWVYRRKGLPVEVLAAFDVWRRVRDMDGEIGWVHVALLSRNRTVVVAAGADAAVRGRQDESASDIIAEAKPGAIGKLMGCGKLACQVKFDGAAGWVERARLWGIRDGEQF